MPFQLESLKDWTTAMAERFDGVNERLDGINERLDRNQERFDDQMKVLKVCQCDSAIEINSDHCHEGN